MSVMEMLRQLIMKPIYQFSDLVDSGLHVCLFVSAHSYRASPSYRETLVLQ